MYDPVNDEPSQCATIRRNIEALSRQRADLRAQIQREETALERLRHSAEAARSHLDLAKERAKAGQERNRDPPAVLRNGRPCSEALNWSRRSQKISSGTGRGRRGALTSKSGRKRRNFLSSNVAGR